MPRRKDRRRARPRAQLLTTEVEARLIEATRMGLSVDLAAVNAGISRSTFMRWRRIGHHELQDRENGAEPNPDNDQLVEFFQKIEQARANAAFQAAFDIRRAARGGLVTTHRKFDPHTGKVIEETITTPPDWRAAAWYLERQHRKQYGKEDHLEIELTGAAGGPVTVHNQGADDLATRLSETLFALQYPDAEDEPET
ncbi:hypothetical protein ACIQ9R_36325 [Streptomyces sp. NPDC094447]|uniref:hypothetical protein n=1 Tax=Streptomyces sp. NPDC094447 TaxID=3366062 RepID=UPI003821F9BA